MTADGKKSREGDLAQMVRALIQGDPSVAGALIDLTQSRLMSFCFYLSKNKVEAQELAQETYLQAFRKIKKIRDPEKFVPWLFVIARSLLLMKVRTGEYKVQKRSDSIESQDSDDTRPQFEIAAVDSADIDSAIGVRDALSKLNPEDRVLLNLVDIQGLTYAEAANALGKSESAIRMKVFRARKAFLEIYESA